MTRRRPTVAAEPNRSPGGAAARERGGGPVSTALGCAVFVAFLLLATQTLVGLYARSVVGAVAADAVSRVARSGGNRLAMAEAESSARRLLGRAGETARFDWSQAGSETEVVLRVRTPAPVLLPAIGPGSEEGRRIDRTVRARVERFHDE